MRIEAVIAFVETHLPQLVGGTRNGASRGGTGNTWICAPRDAAKRDPRRAAELWKRAAEDDYSLAQYNLALAYFRGEGVARAVAAVMAEHLGWDDGRIAAEVASYLESVDRSDGEPGVPRIARF